MRYFEINEDFSAKPNRWVHYSQQPFLKINPKPFHQDAAGIYFFPEEFQAIGMWTKYRYKFTAKLKPANVLDLAHISDEELNAMLDGAGIRAKFEAYIEKYPPDSMNRKMDMAWESLVRYYAFENGEGKLLGKFNKMLRTLGYDCIFDDGKIVHSAEEQLIVLDPRCIEIVSMEKRSGSGFAEMKKVMADVIELCKGYGEVTVAEPKKRKQGWSNDIALEAGVEVRRDERNYLGLKLTTESGDKDVPPSKIHISVQYSSPRLNSSYGSTYDIGEKKYTDWSGSLEHIRLALDKTLPQNDA